MLSIVELPESMLRRILYVRSTARYARDTRNALIIRREGSDGCLLNRSSGFLVASFAMATSNRIKLGRSKEGFALTD